jgi:amino acid transporter
MAAPSRRERTKPAELVLLSLGLGLFAGLVTLLATRDFALGFIFLVIVFIVALVGFAMLSLASKPNQEEELDLGEQDRSGH